MSAELQIDPTDVWPIFVNATLTRSHYVMATGAIATIQELSLLSGVDVLATQATCAARKDLAHPFASPLNQERVVTVLPSWNGSSIPRRSASTVSNHAHSSSELQELRSSANATIAQGSTFNSRSASCRRCIKSSIDLHKIGQCLHMRAACDEVPYLRR